MWGEDITITLKGNVPAPPQPADAEAERTGPSWSWTKSIKYGAPGARQFFDVPEWYTDFRLNATTEQTVTGSGRFLRAGTYQIRIDLYVSYGTSNNSEQWGGAALPTVFEITCIEAGWGPTVDLNGIDEGRGSVPPIPFNASLPAGLSGTGAVKEVEVCAWVYGPPGQYTVKPVCMSAPERLEVPENASVTVTIPGGATWAYSDQSVAIKAKDVDWDPQWLSQLGAYVQRGNDWINAGVTWLPVYIVYGTLGTGQGLTEFAVSGLNTYDTATGVADALDKALPTGGTDSVDGGEVPGGSHQVAAGGAFPEFASNQWQCGTIGADSTGLGTAALSVNAGQAEQGPVDNASGVALDQNERLTIATWPQNIAAGTVVNVTFTITRHMEINTIALTSAIVPGAACIGVSYGCASIGVPVATATAATAVGHHGFLFRDPAGVWSPAPAGR